jgi:hypothetical protein
MVGEKKNEAKKQAIENVIQISTRIGIPRQLIA